jgi:hypothetical protein
MITGTSGTLSRVGIPTMPPISETPSMANTDQGRPTKAQRKEQARMEREEIQRKQASRSRNRAIGIVVGVIVVAAVVGLVLVLGGGGDGNTTASSTAPFLPDPAQLKGIMRTPPPWPNNLQDANERLAELDLPSLSDTILHHHVGLYIYVDGQPVTVPAGIGYNDGTSGGPKVFSPLHTHDDTGLVHVESADPNFAPVLGQFMDVWGLYFTNSCLGDQCNQGDKQLRVYVDGKQYTGDPTLVPLTDLSGIVVTFGTEAQVPKQIPSGIPTAG